jgi:hypothetical protein
MAHSHSHPIRIQSIDGDNNAMLMTCIGGPLHGLQVGIADDALVYEMQDSKPRARYLRQVICAPGTAASPGCYRLTSSTASAVCNA